MYKLELRMYGLAIYQLSGIQAGIQYGHAVNRYGRKLDPERYADWSDNWETAIILNGGSTNLNPDRLGTINKSYATLIANGIPCQAFYEPDLGDQMTAICFLVDERVFNKEKYTEAPIHSNTNSIPNHPIDMYDIINEQNKIKWTSEIGEKNVFLREFLKPFRLWG